jgi:hypothetical protein
VSYSLLLIDRRVARLKYVTVFLASNMPDDVDGAPTSSRRIK